MSAIKVLREKAPTDDELVAIYNDLMARARMSVPGMPRESRTQLLGWDLEYISEAALAACIDFIFLRRMNDFVADNASPYILDCGANIGLTVLNYKQQFPKARIVAFEPDPQFAPILRRNLERNGASDVRIVDAAAWTKDQLVSWRCEGIDGSRICDSSVATTKVKAVDLNRYLEEPIDLLKMDVEGAECQIIPHIWRRLSQVKNILIETHISQTTIPAFAPFWQALVDSGFKLAVNTYGAWRDLIRRPPVSPDHFEQYALVAGWREDDPSADVQSTLLPYAGTRFVEWEKSVERQSELSSELADLKQVVSFLCLKKTWIRAKVRKLKPPFQKNCGLCWTKDFPELEEKSDDESNPRRSLMVLMENGQVLGPGHSPHENIREKGGGRFSHWKTAIYFSSSDGSDPNQNGRTYSILILPESNERDRS